MVFWLPILARVSCRRLAGFLHCLAWDTHTGMREGLQAAEFVSEASIF